MREEIEQAFDMDAVDIYGLSEIMGPGVANECVETKDGLHVWEDHFYPEIIDPETGAVLPEGEMGELVFTSLTKEALPMIRYRTRDLTRLLPGTARSMRRMEKVTGRSDDMIILRGVNVFPTQIEEQLLKCAGSPPTSRSSSSARAGWTTWSSTSRLPRAPRRPRRGRRRRRSSPTTSRAWSASTRIDVAEPDQVSAPRARRSAWWTTVRRNELSRNGRRETREGEGRRRPSPWASRSRKGKRMASTRASDFEEKQHGIL